MLGEASARYWVKAPFEGAVESVCSSCRNRGLPVVGQLDIAERLKRSLGIILPPCRVVFVLPNPATLGADTISPWDAVFLPFHIVVSGDSSQSEVQIQNAVKTGPNAGGRLISRQILEAHRQILEAIESIAVRPSLFT